LAVSLKVYPLVFAPAYLKKGSRRAWLGALAAGLALLSLPLLCFGPALGVSLYGEFLQALRSKGLPIYSHNQSFAALGLRLFTDQPFLLLGYGQTQWTLAQLPAGLVSAAALALGALLAAVSWGKFFRKGGDPASAAAFCILFLSHIVWKDYLLFLYFPLKEIFRLAPRRFSYALAAAVLAVVTFSSPDVLGAAVATRLDGACIHLWTAVLVWIAWLRLKTPSSLSP
jgi:hypothetical protein